MNELKEMPIWVCWKRDPERGKIPKNPRTGGNAQSNNPTTWSTYEKAETASVKHDGIGFMFSEGLAGIDLDKVIGNPEREQRARDIIALMDTYTESSPSGTGYHIIFRVDVSRIPQEKIKNAKTGVYEDKLLPAYYQNWSAEGLECYVSGLTNKFFTYTGEAVNSMDVEERTEQLRTFLDRYMRKPSVKNSGMTPVRAVRPARLDSLTIIEKARKAKNGNKFQALFDRGDITKYKGDDSAADQALCNILAWWCGGDSAQIDELFRQSQLMRSKWDEMHGSKTYGQTTIDKGIDFCNGKYYTPPGRPKKERMVSDNRILEDENQTEYLTINNLERYLKAAGMTARYNLITNDLRITGLEPAITQEHAQNSLPVVVFDQVRFLYKEVHKGDVRDFLGIIALRNKYNPVLDLINSVKWDGTDRLQDIYRILKIADNDELSRTLVFKWLWQCLSMAKNTITDNDKAYGADGMLVLIGDQGIGKTSFFRIISMEDDFFVEGAELDIDKKDTVIKATSGWITELGEIGSTFKSDLDMLKAFIVNKIDVYRKPYGHDNLRLARKTSFCGTCNDTEYLIDPTGNRRFWSVMTNGIDLERLNKLDVPQLWSQVENQTCHDKQGFRLTADEQAELAKRNTSHEKPQRGESEILDILAMAEREPHNYTFEKRTVTEFKLAYEVLKNYTVELLGKALDQIDKKGLCPNHELKCIGREYIDGRRQRIRLLPMRKVIIENRYSGTARDS